MLLLIIYIALWILLYFLEGFHDAFLTFETNEHPPAKDYVKANYYKGMWHKFDSYSYAIFHIGFSMLFAFLRNLSVAGPVEALSTNFLLLTFPFILIGVSIRMFAHDFFYDLGMKRKLFVVPTCQGKWDFWDCWIVKLNNLHPVLPFVLRFAPLTISIIFYAIFFL